jgi:hypothetical protein
MSPPRPPARVNSVAGFPQYGKWNIPNVQARNYDILHGLDTYYHMLDAYYHMLDAYYHMLDAYYHMLDAYYHMLDTYCYMLDTYCYMLDTYCHMLDAYYYMLDAYCHMLEVHQHRRVPRPILPREAFQLRRRCACQTSEQACLPA